MCSVTKDGCGQSESPWNGKVLLGLSLDLQGLWAHGMLPVQVFLQGFLQLQRQTHNSSLFWAFPGVFHGKGQSELGVPSISAGNHLQNLGSRQKGVAGVTLLGCLWCLLQVWPWRTHCDIWGCSWYAFSPTQPFLIQTN